MNVVFQIKGKNVACTPRKSQLVASLIRQRTLEDALIILEHTPKKAATIFSKLLQNAQATAVHNYKLKKESLQIETVFVTGGQMLKRYRLLYRGRMRSQVQVQKKRSHIHLTISGQKVASPKKEVKKETKKEAEK